jgi:hypothetical protein
VLGEVLMDNAFSTMHIRQGESSRPEEESEVRSSYHLVHHLVFPLAERIAAEINSYCNNILECKQ